MRDLLNPGPAMKFRHTLHLVWQRSNWMPDKHDNKIWVCSCECCCILCEQPFRKTLYRVFDTLSTAGANKLFKEKK